MTANKTAIANALLICLVILVTSPVQAEQGADAAKKLLLESLEAMGGEKVAGWETRVETGLLTTHWEGWGELRAECGRWVKKPDKMKIDQDFSAYNHPFFFTYYYTGGDVWAMVNLGVRQNPRYTTRLTDLMKKVDGLSYSVTECDTFFAVPEIPDDSLISAADIERVGVVDNGDTVLIDIDRKTHFLRRTIDKDGSQTLLEDYRSVNGRMVSFHVVTYENGKMSSEYVWAEIKFDEPVDDTIFEEYRPPPEDAD